MWEMELDFARRANAQTNICIADIERMDSFTHIGAEHSYNGTSKKVRIAKRISTVPGGAAAIETYFWLKRKLKRALLA